MIAPFVRELEQVFGWLLAASWQASVLALFVLVIQRMLGSRLNPRWRYALWLLVLLRLVLPVQPESALSLFQFAPPPPAQLVTTVTEPWQPLFTGKPYPSPSDPEPMVKPNYPFSYFTLLAFLWLGGAMILLVLTWEANRRFARQVANSPEISDPELLKLFAEARAELGVRRAIRLIENNQLQSPAIMGLFQPTLLLPADVRGKFDERELRFIFLHELAHLKRGDVMVQALIALLQILHWFNPALWYAFRRMRIDREPATDALVLSRTGEAEKEHYGLMLIKLLEHFNQRHSLPTLVGILEDKDQFKRRFSLIARFTRGAYGWSVLGVLLIGVLSVACLTKSKATETPDTPKADATANTTADKLQEASGDGNIPLMTKLLALGVDPNKPGVWFRDGPKVKLTTPLAAAVNSGSVQAVALLLDHGAKTEGDKAKLMVIAVEAHPAIAKLLWSRGNRDVSPLSYAISQGASAADIAKLLDQGSPADSPQDDTITPLGFVAQKGNLDLVKLLVARGADVDKGSIYDAQDSDTPVALAAFNGQDEVVDYLLAHGAKPDPAALYEAAHNSTPYQGERTHDHFEKTVRLLLDAGALKNATPEEQGYIVYAPIWTRQGPPNATVLKMILDAGGNPNAPMPFTAENGEKPNTVIGYYRDYCARHKEDPNFGTGWEKIKPLLDMLEAADKGAAPKADADANTTDPSPTPPSPRREHTIYGHLFGQKPSPVDFTRSSGELLSVDKSAGHHYVFTFQADGSFIVPNVVAGVYGTTVHLVPKGNTNTTTVAAPIDLTLAPITVDAASEKVPYNVAMAVNFIVPAKGSIQVEFKVVEIQDDVYLAHQAEIDAGVEKGGAEIFNLFNNLKGMSMLSAPSVTTKPGLKASIDIVREFPYPTSFDPAKVIQGVSVQGIGTNLTANVAPTPRDFVTADVGVKAEITPSLEQGKIILNGKFSVIDFEGFTKSNLAGVHMPSFETRETHFYEALDDNQLMGIWIPGAHFDEQTVTDHDSLGKIISEKKEAVKKRLLIFLQARLVK